MRLGAFLFFLVLSPMAAQSETRPLVTATLSSEKTAVGQPLFLTIEVLVSTFMPVPPQFPDFDQAGLLVQLPPRSGSPLSRRIDGDSWSGVSRRYRIIPLQEGRYSLPAAEVLVTWAGDDISTPQQALVPLPALQLRATVPEAAADLDPPVLAAGLELEQTIEGGPELNAGDAITRTVTATISGTTPILLPRLLATDSPSAALRAYPAEIRSEETEDRGKLAGRRIEQVSYVAVGEGSTELPEIALAWYDLSSATVKTAVLPAVPLSISPPPPVPPSPAKIIVWVLTALCAGAGFWKLYRVAAPPVKTRMKLWQARYMQSQRYAHRKILAALSARNLFAAQSATATWLDRLPDAQSNDTKPQTNEMLAALGEAQFSTRVPADSKNLWRRALLRARRLGVRKNDAKSVYLPDTLNDD